MTIVTQIRRNNFVVRICDLFSGPAQRRTRYAQHQAPRAFKSQAPYVVCILYDYNLDVLGVSVCRCNYYEFIWYDLCNMGT